MLRPVMSAPTPPQSGSEALLQPKVLNLLLGNHHAALLNFTLLQGTVMLASVTHVSASMHTTPKISSCHHNHLGCRANQGVHYQGQQKYLQAMSFYVGPEGVQDRTASGLLQAQHSRQGC